MFNLRSFVSRALVALFLFVLVPIVTRGEDLLYARVDNQLFTVDTQTGALTFVSDGPLSWLATPTFDEVRMFLGIRLQRLSAIYRRERTPPFKDVVT